MANQKVLEIQFTVTGIEAVAMGDGEDGFCAEVWNAQNPEIRALVEAWNDWRSAASIYGYTVKAVWSEKWGRYILK